MTSELRLNALVVCEEVRPEVDGRCTMIGVWPENTIFLDAGTDGKQKLPTLNLYFQFSGEAGVQSIQVHVTTERDGYMPFDLGTASFVDEMNVVNLKLSAFPTLGFGRHYVAVNVGNSTFNTWFDVRERAQGAVVE